MSAYVILEWDASTTSAEGLPLQPGDLLRYRVVRKAPTSTTWATSCYVHPDHTKCLVVQADGTTYQYGVYAIGRGGKQSPTMSNVITCAVPVVAAPAATGATIQKE